MILLTADIHLNDLSRDQYRHDWMANILPALLKKHSAELLIILGDLCDDKDRHSAWLTNQLVDHLVSITEICDIIVLKANHDYIVADNPFFEFLGRIPGITWINKPTEAKALPILPMRMLLGEGDLFLPHTHNPKRDWESIEFDHYDRFYTHQTFAGAQVGPRTLEGVDPRIFPPTSTVISGDIHQPQTFGPVTYCGSPYLEDFGDSFKPRVLLLDPEKDTLRSIPSPGPQKRLIEFTRPHRKIDRPWTEYFECNASPGDILKVRVTLDAADHAQWPTIQQEVKAWGAKNGFVIHLVQPKIENVSGGKGKVRKVDNRTDEQLLDTYAQSRAVGEATLKTGQNLMRKV